MPLLSAPVLGIGAGSGGASGNGVTRVTAVSTLESVPSGLGEDVKPPAVAKPEEDEDEEMKTIFAGPVASRRHHSTINQPPISGLSYVDYKSLHERLQQHAVNGVGLVGMESPSSLFR